VCGEAPRRPFFLVCNHLTYLDVALLAGQLGCLIVSRADVQDWPVVGILSKYMETIFINRESLKDTLRANSNIAMALENGEGVALFAEARTSTGCEVRRFKSALLESAVQKGCPVYYAIIQYRTPEGCPPASHMLCWGTDETFFAHGFRMLRLPKFYASLTFGDQPISGTDRKALADELWQAVQTRFTPIL
jgi:1-acyl-sn-glycerol-3-phosphate acyltransferase